MNVHFLPLSRFALKDGQLWLGHQQALMVSAPCGHLVYLVLACMEYTLCSASVTALVKTKVLVPQKKCKILLHLVCCVCAGVGKSC